MLFSTTTFYTLFPLHLEDTPAIVTDTLFANAEDGWERQSVVSCLLHHRKARLG